MVNLTETGRQDIRVSDEKQTIPIEKYTLSGLVSNSVRHMLPFINKPDILLVSFSVLCSFALRQPRGALSKPPSKKN